MSLEEKTTDIKNVYDGKVLKLELHTVELCNGNNSMREIIRHRGGVAIIPITDKNEIYLVRQYRKPYEQEILEVPAGKLEKDEKPECCAIRELKEETGLTAERLTMLTIMYPSPGYTDEKIYIYKAEGLTQGEYCLDEDEFINVEKYTLNQGMEMVRNGTINDAKSIIAILMLYNSHYSFCIK